MLQKVASLNPENVIEGDRTGLAKASIGVACLFLVFSALMGLSFGPSGVYASDLIGYLFSFVSGAETSPHAKLIIETIRLPRVLLGILVGAGLAVSGAVLQGLFRNPLADPGIIGVSAGASLGAVLMIVLGGTVLAPMTALMGIFSIPVAAFLGAFAVTLTLHRLATSGGQTSIATLLLGGIAIAALIGALTGILIFMADDTQLRDLTFWGLGSLAGATWSKVLSAGSIIGIALLATPFLAKGLNALALGEASAHHLGIPVQHLKNTAIVTVAAATGAAVAVSGGIGFVGIVVPHLLRLAIGPDNRYLLPASATLGASLLLFCDMMSRLIVAPAELPIGIVTALVGAPFFLWILLRQRGILAGF